MKKCPKCGTILDDSKKKCYMCGANLVQPTSVNSFSSNFDADIGARVTKGSDNVFNNGKDIDVDTSDIVDGEINNNGSFFSHNSSSRDYFGGEINKLNTSRNKATSNNSNNKTFFNKSGKVSKKNIPKEMMDSIVEKKQDELVKKDEVKVEKKKQNIIKSNFIETKRKKDEGIPDVFNSFNSVENNEIIDNKKDNSFDIFNSNKKKEEVKEPINNDNNPFSMFNNSNDNKEFIDNKPKDNFFNEEEPSNIDGGNIFDKKKKISFFNNIKEDKKEFFNDEYQDDISNQSDFSRLKKEKQQVKVNINMPRINFRESGRAIFNITCMILFIVMMVFVYFKWLRVDTYEELSGLKFRVPPTFKLKLSEANSKYYESTEFDNACSIRLLVGPAADPDGYVESYFRYVKSLYAEDKSAVLNLMEMSINGQKWKNEKVVFIPTDNPSVDASSIIPRYSYTIMTYNGMFYSINYVNINENKDCNDDLNNFMNSVQFKDSNVK